MALGLCSLALSFAFAAVILHSAVSGNVDMTREITLADGHQHAQARSNQATGVPAFLGAEVAVHFSAQGKIETVNGSYQPGLRLDVTGNQGSRRARNSEERYGGGTRHR